MKHVSKPKTGFKAWPSFKNELFGRAWNSLVRVTFLWIIPQLIQVLFKNHSFSSLFSEGAQLKSFDGA